METTIFEMRKKNGVKTNTQLLYLYQIATVHKPDNGGAMFSIKPNTNKTDDSHTAMVIGYYSLIVLCTLMCFVVLMWFVLRRLPFFISFNSNSLEFLIRFAYSKKREQFSFTFFLFSSIESERLKYTTNAVDRNNHGKFLVCGAHS